MKDVLQGIGGIIHLICIFRKDEKEKIDENLIIYLINQSTNKPFNDICTWNLVIFANPYTT